MTKNIYWFNEIGKGDTGIVGGKGANLGEMFNNGFPVPEGFCVGAQTYFDFIRERELDKFIHSQLDSLDVQDTRALDAASEAIKHAISSAVVPNDIRADIVKAYNRMCRVDLIPSAKDEINVAVRSSATAEDLPGFSFAGQQATFLNVHGADGVVAAVKDCWASLFEARAIYYRSENRFDHMSVGLCAVVQAMVESDASGVMFTADPIANDASRIVVEAGYGLGEMIVSGQITPDHYVIDKGSLTLLEKQIQLQQVMLVRVNGENQHVQVPPEIQERQKIPDDTILKLAGYGKKIEEHYRFPQDIEWAVSADSVFIVQSRPITTLKDASGQIEKPETAAPSAATVAAAAAPLPIPGQTPNAQPSRGETMSPTVPPTIHVVNDKGETVQAAPASTPKPAAEQAILVKGLSASPGIAVGPVRIIMDLNELYKVKQGDVLVTKMTTPDFVPAMKRACAILTDEGGSTAHAAIVSRELGIPCIVGSRTATSVLKDGQVITIDAIRGVVYDGAVAMDAAPKTQEQKIAEHVVASAPLVTGTKIYVNLAEADAAERVAAQNVDGVGLLRAEFMIADINMHPRKAIKDGKQAEFIDTLARGLRKFCAAFYPRPVIYRATDFKTNEYRSLPGGAEFEPQEDNPMIGYRGCFRYIKDPASFALELEAIKKVREGYGMKNLWLMIPMVRTIREFKIVKELVEESGLHRSYDFKLGIMCEVPSTIILAEEFCQAGADFFSIGSNDLTQLTLGIDRDNSIIAEEFDERDEAIYRSIKLVIERCHKYGVPVGICGQAPSVYKEFAEKLVEFGIDSISCNPDVIDATRKTVAAAELKVLLKGARKNVPS